MAIRCYRLSLGAVPPGRGPWVLGLPWLRFRC